MLTFDVLGISQPDNTPNLSFVNLDKPHTTHRRLVCRQKNKIGWVLG